jgi:hypothetical protein
VDIPQLEGGSFFFHYFFQLYNKASMDIEVQVGFWFGIFWAPVLGFELRACTC